MKRAIITVSPEALLLVMETGAVFRVVESGLPRNAQLRDAWYSLERQCFCVAIESDELPYDVREGDVLPYLDPPHLERVEL